MSEGINQASAATVLNELSRMTRTENTVSVLLGILQVCMTVLFAYQVAHILQLTLMQPTPAQIALDDWVLLSASLICKVLAGYVQSLIGNKASLIIRHQFRRQVLQHCARLNVSLFPGFSVSELSNLLTAEINHLREYFSDFVAQKYLAVLMPIGVLIASAQVNWLVPVILALTAPLIPLFMILLGKKTAAASRDNLVQLNRLGSLLSDRIKHLTCLQLAGTTHQEADKIFQQSEQFRMSTMKVLRLAFLSGTLLEFFSAVSVALVAVYLGLFFLGKYDLGDLSGELSLFDGVFLLILAPEFYLPLRKLGSLYHAKADATAVAEHYLKLKQLSEDFPPEGPQAEKQEIELQTLSASNLQAGPPEKPLHQPLSFNLNAGDKLLLNGVSGAGKTTLLDTLAGLRPVYHGSLLLNGAQRNLFQRKDWYQVIGYMPQKAEIMHTSIRENLCLGRTFTDEALYHALEQARAAKLVRDLPGGLDYQVSDGGGYLSGGQAQRLALARVFLHKPGLLLLDEPTANLDAETASEFMHSLEQYCQAGGMIIMASHRPAEKAFFTQIINIKEVEQ
ncbi:MAG: thiol reductant ABC exporter subunit CydD [Neptuniibacter caesariensis]|uniref:Thiol reductant ABC exporter subunit CydD n=1 Tax=Neptuniibacter caesariensis TaxID=207954 RepID=A0A2G6JAV2_NEPCE|nr:MAG: thiol reductant ABC exporter subunit CydD [Neptuniibacter caesariensis]